MRFLNKEDLKVGALVGFVVDAQQPYRFTHLSVVIGHTRPHMIKSTVPVVYCFETTDIRTVFWLDEWVLVSPAPEIP